MSEDQDFGKEVLSLEEGKTVFDRYLLRRILGRGGMGVVWLAEDQRLNQEVALKFLPELLSSDESALNELKEETKRNFKLTHPNIVRIYDFIQKDYLAAISMEYIDGDPLSKIKSREPKGCFDPKQIKDWLDQLCDALDYAHNEARLIHRDIKPANILIDSRNKLKISDFGISASICESFSRVSRKDKTSGTLAYMSPQQALGKSPRPSDDIYSVGSLIFELLSGKPPFYRGDIQAQLQHSDPTSIAQRRKELDISVDVPSAWEALVSQCLSKQPSERPQTMLELKELIQMAFEGQTLSMAPTLKSQKVESKSTPVRETSKQQINSEQQEEESQVALWTLVGGAGLLAVIGGIIALLVVAVIAIALLRSGPAEDPYGDPNYSDVTPDKPNPPKDPQPNSDRLSEDPPYDAPAYVDGPSLTVTEFINNFITAGNTGAGTTQSFFYDTTAYYYGRGSLTRTQIQSDINTYQNKWPTRNYNLIGSPKIEKQSNGEYYILARVGYYVENKQKKIEGEVENYIFVRQSGQNWVITEISSDTLRRDVKEKRDAWITSCWTEFNRWNGDYKGFWSHTHFNVQGMKGKKIRVALFVYYGDRKKVFTKFKGFYTPEGQLTSQTTSVPKYDNTEWKDFKLFVPYGAIQKRYHSSNLYYEVEVIDNKTNTLLTRSERQYFEIK